LGSILKGYLWLHFLLSKSQQWKYCGSCFCETLQGCLP